MLLLITTSTDVTADLVVRYASIDVFRLNVDTFLEYEIECGPDFWLIKDPTGRSISSLTATRCFRWKTRVEDSAFDRLIRGEILYVVDEIYCWFLRRAMVVGNPPWTDRLLGKIAQAQIASKYFKIPKQKFVSGGSEFRGFDGVSSVVAKSLSSELTDDGRALFVKRVESSEIDYKFPWMFQELIDSEDDVTVLKFGGETWAFRRSRSELSGVDWRQEMFTTSQNWQTFTLESSQLDSLERLMSDFGLNWGRLDFLLVDEELVFLEINPNGQWAFLDPHNELGMISDVSRWICESPTHS